VEKVVGARILGTLGAVALTAGLLTACGGQEEPPADSAATSSPTPGTSSPSPEAGAGDPGPDASVSSEPTAGPEGDAGDGAATDEPSATPEDEPRDEPGDEPSGEPSPDDSAGDDAGDDAGQPEEGDGPAQGDDASEGTGDDAKDDEPKKPDHVELGEVSNRVGELQQRLQDLGYFVTSVDDAYGAETQQAVFALQKAAGLYRDGVVGDATMKAADTGVVPQAQTSSGKVLEIDIDRQLVLAVEDGQVVKVINASSGNGETYEAKGNTYTAYTPRGSFAVYREENRMYSSSLELGDMWRPKFFTGGIALHGSASVPAFPASHGCVRVSNSAMDWIWDTWGAPSGTPVVVY
jgi:peptidoglycan hydrolase-like protein with peptidoglycan-binding domain